MGKQKGNTCPGCHGKKFQTRTTDGIRVICPMCQGTGVFDPIKAREPEEKSPWLDDIIKRSRREPDDDYDKPWKWPRRRPWDEPWTLEVDPMEPLIVKYYESNHYDDQPRGTC
jgi:uncharacterized Zn finger protein (UPF0148 family)